MSQISEANRLVDAFGEAACAVDSLDDYRSARAALLDFITAKDAEIGLLRNNCAARGQQVSRLTQELATAKNKTEAR